MSDAIHPLAAPHLPPFITPPGETDVLMVVMIVFLVAIILIVGNLYLRLHALPERMAHRASKVQFEIVAVLALLALFTHNNLYWVAALLLALIRIPDFSTPLAMMAEAQERIARRLAPAADPEADVTAALQKDDAVVGHRPAMPRQDEVAPRREQVVVEQEARV